LVDVLQLCAGSERDERSSGQTRAGVKAAPKSSLSFQNRCGGKGHAEVINGGVETVVEDWPGRIGYLDNGWPPLAPSIMWPLVFQIFWWEPVNEAGIEIAGGYFEAGFDMDTVIAVTAPI